RRIATVNPAEPHEVTAYDHLDRPTKRALVDDGAFSAIPPTVSNARSVASGIEAATSGKGWFEETFYDQRGMVYRTETAADPNSSNPGTRLGTHYWHDADGRIAAEWSPNSPGIVREFDGAGRTTST